MFVLTLNMLLQMNQGGKGVLFLSATVSKIRAPQGWLFKANDGFHCRIQHLTHLPRVAGELEVLVCSSLAGFTRGILTAL